MKKIFSMLMAMATSALVFTGCSTDDPYITAGPDDMPRILQPDLPQGTDGQPAVYKSLKTDEPLDVTVIVTPAEYTTVKWYDENWTPEAIAEGLSINQELVAGEHDIKVVATTTAGKSTSRTFRVNVTALPTDPAYDKDGQSRWLNPGATHTAAVQNFDNVARMCFGDTDVPFTYADGKITFTVPNMEEAKYRLFFFDKDGKKYCNGEVTVSSGEYVPETVKVLWEGEQQVDWAIPASINEVYPKLKELAEEGSILTVHVEETAADYHTACAVIDWAHIVTGHTEGQREDTTVSGSMDIKYELTKEAVERIQRGGEFGIVGFGCKATKITIEAPAEKVIYEGPSDKLDWNGVLWKTDDGTYDAIKANFKVGTVVKAYVTADEGAAGAIVTTWWNNFNNGAGWDKEGGCRVDMTAGDHVLEMTIETLDFLNEQGFGVVGNGFVVNKITVK